MQKYFCPIGMVETLSKILSADKSKRIFNLLPEAVKKSNLKITEETFDINDIVISTTTDGIKGFNDFDYVFCTVCHANWLPNILIKYKDQIGQHTLI